MSNNSNCESQFFSSLKAYILSRWEHDIEAAEGCQSPIESMFYSAMHMVVLLSDEFGVSVSLDTQWPVGRYSADFHVVLMQSGIYDKGGRELFLDSSVIVECDGHEFHEKTKEQVSRDKKRDREMQKSGYRVFRFSGSDIWKDSFACAREVFEFLMSSLKSSQKELCK